MGYGYVDELLNDFKSEKPDGSTPENPREKKTKHRNTTLHRRDLEHSVFYAAARFFYGMTKVRARVDWTTLRIPQVLELGEIELSLPVWHKTGAGWEFSEYKKFNKEALGVTMAMMRAIGRYLDMRESDILNALHLLSIISVTIGPDGRKRYRHACSGRLINPVDGQLLNFPEFKHLECFVLDRKRADEWIQKVLDSMRKHSA
jgi:hypothetical protein